MNLRFERSFDLRTLAGAAMKKLKDDPILDGALPVMRDYIVQTWWDTRLPVQASKGDADVRKRAGLAPKSNPSGWWGRAWTAVEAARLGEHPRDEWMMLRFEHLFRGLSRVSRRQPYRYVVTDPGECPPAQIEFERAVAMWTEGQGRVEGVEERRAIEAAGMREGRSWLLGEGFTDDQIKDTSATKPWDLEAERGGKKWYVEAKGSGSAWSDDSTVIVTRNEVLHAREHPDSCALIVAASCKLSRGDDGRLLATPAQTVVVSPWNPVDDDLSPLAYRYRPGLLEAILQLKAIHEVPIGRAGDVRNTPANNRLRRTPRMSSSERTKERTRRR
jgi:hypothetical protein